MLSGAIAIYSKLVYTPIALCCETSSLICTWIILEISRITTNMSLQTLSKLQQLERSHAGEEELADIRHSEALSTDASKVKSGYFLSTTLIGALLSISLSTVYEPT